ncbi:hypothetical protein ACNR9Q_07555 [Maribacter sp. X9]|uniref:hypothetical protein n=1 Tax=Maribacter sp. X9 TaxID=3402159 RepID=UPI003AF3BFB8
MLEWNNAKKMILSCILAFILTLGCSKDGEAPAPAPSPPSNPDSGNGETKSPTSVELVFPFKDSQCEEGSQITAEESTVTFEWKESDYTDSYGLTIKNLNSGAIAKYETNGVNLPIRLQRGVPYEWYVTSVSSEVSSIGKSEIWRFYNQGEGIENYIPFPAQAVNPLDNTRISETSIVLEWSGLDIDNDIVGYDVYFGTSNPPTTLVLSNSLERRISNISVSVGKYYWFVVTNDSAGNTSESQIFNFKVQ